MPHDLDELHAIDDRLTGILDSGVRERLMALPDVVHVAVGLREARGRAVIDDFVFKVYVHEKVPAAELSPERLVPGVVEGVGTDVCEVLKGAAFIRSVAAEEPFPAPDRPLIGGTMICNGIRGKVPSRPDPVVAPGTMGIVAARLSDRKPVVLTNWHVVSTFQGAPGDPLYQPVPGEAEYPSGDTYPKKPVRATNDVATVSAAKLTHQVDAAIAQVNPRSSCCNCGATYTLLIKGLNRDGSSGGITGSAAPVSGMEVVKVGARTGRVEGTVLTTEAPVDITYEDGPLEWTFTGQLLIQGHENDRTPAEAPKLFADHGDSGAVIVERTTRKVVALLWGGRRPPPVPRRRPCRRSPTRSLTSSRSWASTSRTVTTRRPRQAASPTTRSTRPSTPRRSTRSSNAASAPPPWAARSWSTSPRTPRRSSTWSTATAAPPWPGTAPRVRPGSPPSPAAPGCRSTGCPTRSRASPGSRR